MVYDVGWLKRLKSDFAGGIFGLLISVYSDSLIEDTGHVHCLTLVSFIPSVH